MEVKALADAPVTIAIFFYMFPRERRKNMWGPGGWGAQLFNRVCELHIYLFIPFSITFAQIRFNLGNHPKLILGEKNKI